MAYQRLNHLTLLLTPCILHVAAMAILLWIYRDLFAMHVRLDAPQQKLHVSLESSQNLTYWEFNRSNLAEQRFEPQVRFAVDDIHRRNFTPPVNEKCKKRPPAAILIGASKCGTRELMEFLHMHPHIEIYQKHNKTMEMPYFNSMLYEKGIDWLVNEMPCSYSNQLTVINAAYFDLPIPTAERIQKFNSSIKLILIVREPISRTISRYMFDLQRGVIKPGTALEEIIFRNSTLIKDHKFIRESVYSDNMEVWLKYFSLTQFLVLDSNEFKFSPAKVIRQIEEFLRLSHFITPDHFVWNDEKGFYCIKSSLSDSGMVCYSKMRGKQAIDISPQTREILKEFFRPKVKRFFDITGCIFDWGYK